MPQKFPIERRNHPRSYVPLVATVLENNARLGEYLVQNLSAGGALLVHGPAIAPGTLVHIIVRGPGIEAVPLHAIALRCEATTENVSTIAVKFQNLSPGIEDFIQMAVLRAREQQGLPAVLVVYPKPMFLASLAEDLGALGRRVILAVTPLDTIRWLCDLETSIDVVVVDWSCQEWSAGEDYGAGVMELVMEEFPALRRVVTCRDFSALERAQLLARGAAHAVLHAPWTKRDLEAALRGERALTERASDGALIQDRAHRPLG